MAIPRLRRNGDCIKCGTWRYSLHRDHVIPKWKGGADDESNTQYLCANCHEDKTREENTGRKLSPEHRANIARGHRGLKRSAEARQRMSAAQKGSKKWNPTERARISEQSKLRWQDPAYRKTQSLSRSRGQRLRWKNNRINLKGVQ